MLNQLMKPMLKLMACAVLLCSLLPAGAALAQGTLEKIRVAGPSLQGNLAGDDAVRDVHVYLPAGYAAGNKRYPVVYFLHGYGVGADVYAGPRVLNLPTSADQAIAAGAQEAIIVMPDAYTVYGGSMYSNSPTTGDWESFVAQDLVSYIDSHYRTLATRASRGLAGHSMGGYGTLRIGMKHPELYGALYAMSSCCLMNQAPNAQAVTLQMQRLADGSVKTGKGFENAPLAQLAAWSPNPQNAPSYLEWPYVNGEAQPVVQARWPANSPLVFVDQYVTALQQYKAIMLDVGDKDSLATTNSQMDAALTRLGIAHAFEVYEGDHGNRVGQRFIDKLLPFFSQHLTAE